jgi:hypothetical protein
MAIEILDLKAPPVRVIEVGVFGLALQLHAGHRLHTRELINNLIILAGQVEFGDGLVRATIDVQSIQIN